MKKYVQEATDINIWKSIQQNTFDRGGDIKSFIECLNLIEEILPRIDIYKKSVVRLTGGGNIKEQDEQFKTGCEEIIKAYKYVFESEKEE